MIDDSKITEAVNAYIGYPKEIDEGVGTSMRRDAFKAGITWFTSTIWHDANEKPEFNRRLITQHITLIGELGYDLTTNIPTYPWELYVKGAHITKWCYIEDILPSPNNSTRLNKAQKGLDSYDGDIIKKLPKIQGIE